MILLFYQARFKISETYLYKGIHMTLYVVQLIEQGQKAYISRGPIISKIYDHLHIVENAPEITGLCAQGRHTYHL